MLNLRKIIKRLLNIQQINYIQYGTGSITAAANTMGTSSKIIFEKAYKTTPKIFVQIWYPNGGATSPANNANRMMQPALESNTEFVIRFFNNTTAQETYYYNWFAIGEIE